MVKKILQIGYLDPTKNYGGVEKYILNLSKSLKNDYDVQVDILCADKVSSISKSDFGNIICLKVPFFGNENMFFVSKYLYGRLARKYIDKNFSEYDAIHFHGDNGLIGDKWSKKTVLTLHGVARSTSTAKDRIVSFLPVFIEKNNVKKAKMIFSMSTAAKEFFERYNTEIRLIKQSIDTSIYHKFTSMEKRNARNKLDIPDDIIVGIIIGRDPKRKGLKIAIDAVENVQDPRLRLYAIGFPAEERNENKVKFTGDIDEETKIAYLAASYFFIFPSMKEGFPISVLEAALSGLSLIVSKQSGVTELETIAPFFREIESYDPLDYASAINDFIKSHSQTEPIEFKNNSYEIEKYSIVSSTRIYMEAYGSITEGVKL